MPTYGGGGFDTDAYGDLPVRRRVAVLIAEGGYKVQNFLFRFTNFSNGDSLPPCHEPTSPVSVARFAAVFIWMLHERFLLEKGYRKYADRKGRLR